VSPSKASSSRTCVICNAPLTSGGVICPACMGRALVRDADGSAAEPLLPVGRVLEAQPTALSHPQSTLACAVCGKPTNAPRASRANVLSLSALGAGGSGQSVPLPNSGMNHVKGNILAQVRARGSFQTGRLTEFWQTQTEALCTACARKVEEAETARKQAKQLLEEAHRLDPTDEPIARNLRAVQ